jgi:hypothetical protein
MSIELLPCPFCGGPAEFIPSGTNPEQSFDDWKAGCVKCEMITPQVSGSNWVAGRGTFSVEAEAKAKLAAKWNARSTTDFKWTLGDKPPYAPNAWIDCFIVVVWDNGRQGKERQVIEATYRFGPFDADAGWYTGHYRRDDLNIIAWTRKPEAPKADVAPEYTSPVHFTKTGRYGCGPEDEDDVYTISEFRDHVQDSSFVDHDGYGCPVKDRKADKSIIIKPSRIADIPADATHIVWFNR